MSVTSVITVAAGAFAPGHLGELTRIVPFELIDSVLEETGARERRLRLAAVPGRGLLPAGAGVVPAAWLPGGVGEADRGAGRAGPGRALGEGAAGSAPPPGRRAA